MTTTTTRLQHRPLAVWAVVSALGLAIGVCLAQPATTETSTGQSAPEVAETSKFMEFALQDYLLGDWGGLRTRLSERGVDFEFFYAGAVPWNMHGGIDEGAVYQGLFWMTLDLDSEKLVGYHGGRFHYGTLWLHGQDHFSDEHIGDFNKVSTIDFPNAFRLLDLWYEQKLFRDTVSLKVGQLTVDQDFIVPEFYNSVGYISYVNQTFFFPTLAFNVWDIPGFPVGPHALASIPYGALGARLRVDPCPQAYFQAAVYDGFPNVSSSYVDYHLDSDEGALAYFEMGYKINQGKEDKGLPGNLKLGAYLQTSDYPDNEDAILGLAGLTPGTRTHAPNYGFYFLADSMIYLEEGRDDPARQGLAGFFRVAGAPDDRNLTEFGIDGGLAYRGLFPGRDYDSLGIGASYLEMSDDIADAQLAVNQLAPGAFTVVDYEALVELTYKAQLTAWWTLSTSLQRVIHPGGKSLGDIPDAWALVFLSTLRL